MKTFRLRPAADRHDSGEIQNALAGCATPLPSVCGSAEEADAALDPLMDRIGDASFVLLGEASHGTSEYYLWRRRITERLVRERGFDFVAVEGDWPDCAEVNRYVRGAEQSDGAAAGSPEEVLRTFQRWPTWMWANEEVAGLMTALREINAGRPEKRRVGFYGLDVYSLWDSLARIRDYLAEYAPESLESADDAFACFGSEFGDEQGYARRTAWMPNSCEKELLDLLAKTRKAALRDGVHAFDAEQNALAARDAEQYYRTMTSPGPDSWNVRDRHMTETLARLLDYHSDPGRGGRRAKAIVWEHNTHIGDARATDMAAAGMVNVGQLARERFGAGECVLVGFGSHRGSVIAGRRWDAPAERMPLPEARANSWEDLMNTAFDGGDRLLIFPTDDEADETVAPLHDCRGHRAVGVVYRPEAEHGNYAPTDLAARYDAFLYVDRTHALRPLHDEPTGAPSEVPETYPSGV